MAWCTYLEGGGAQKDGIALNATEGTSKHEL